MRYETQLKCSQFSKTLHHKAIFWVPTRSKAFQASELMSWFGSILGKKGVFSSHRLVFKNQNTFPLLKAACSSFLKIHPELVNTCTLTGRWHGLWLASEERLTAAATLAVGLPSRQQHLQAVPKHDCSRCPGLHYRKICWEKKRQWTLIFHRLSTVR